MRNASIVYALALLLFTNTSEQSFAQSFAQSTSTTTSSYQTAFRNHRKLYAGSKRCSKCHPHEYKYWLKSDHAQAMSSPTTDNVIGHFDTTFTHNNVVTKFFKEDGVHKVLTKNDKGMTLDYPVVYTFGVYPLQQYLLPLENGKLQALSIAWDARPHAEGGQRWFHLFPQESTTSSITKVPDVLHWTSLANNWNTNCSDCHSTNVYKNYNPQTQSYSTNYSDINVGCEACHGPAATHIKAHEEKNPALDTKKLTSLTSQTTELNACAPCHSRRTQLSDGFNPASHKYLNYYLPAFLQAGLYYPDGQILDEVFVYGSFLSSKMYQRGVRCSHCHEPHSGKLKAKDNLLCTQCHNESGHPNFPTLKKSSYDTFGHHHHPSQSSGSQCVSCHMPSKIYMGVDARRDHRFSHPRPDLSISIDVPNPCTTCHGEMSLKQASNHINNWFGSVRKPHWGQALAKAQQGYTQGAKELKPWIVNSKVPAIIRATALQQLASFPQYVRQWVPTLLGSDVPPLVRIAALRALRALSPREQWSLAAPLLTTTPKTVRVEAAKLLSPLTPMVTGQELIKLHQAIDELLDTLIFNEDRPEAQTVMAEVYQNRGELKKAESALRTALKLNPSWVPARINLADLYRITHRDHLAESLLIEAVTLTPDVPDVLIARGLWLVRHKKLKQAVKSFAQANKVAPYSPRSALIYASALHATGKSQQAIEVLEKALTRQPYNVTLLKAAFNYAKSMNQGKRAQFFLDKLKQTSSKNVY